MMLGYAIGGALVLFVMLSCAFHVVGSANKRREEELIAARGSDTPEQFVASFADELQQPIAIAMYEELQKHTHTKRMPFRKSDRLTAFHMDPDDVRDAIQRVAAKFGRRPRRSSKTLVTTIEDCVELVNESESV